MVYPLGHRWTQTPAAPVLWHSSLTLSLNQIYHITKMTNLFRFQTQISSLWWPVTQQSNCSWMLFWATRLRNYVTKCRLSPSQTIFFGFLNLQWLNRNSQLYTGHITGIDQGANNLPDRNCTYDTYDGFPKAKWVQKCRKSQLEKPSLVIIHSFLKFCTCCLHKQKSWKHMKEPNPHPVNHPASQACFFAS